MKPITEAIIFSLPIRFFASYLLFRIFKHSYIQRS
jgi:hypothetical protein